ncbi:MAG: hypothetical protein KDE55_20895 [Novosphingobium sp.]|nr:hypothetical protein [Novosphingobium sp.]
MRVLLVVGFLLALAGCGQTMSADEKANSDASDVAYVEAVQDRHPPVETIAPQPITFTDIEAHDLFGAGCYILVGDAEEMVFLGDDVRGAIKLDGEIVGFAADTGSPELPYASRERYTGKAYWVELHKADVEGTPYGEESIRWPGTIAIYDRWERPIYSAKGTLECGA